MNAAAKLKILDIALWESTFKRGVDYPNVEDTSTLEFQFRRGVRVDEIDAVADDGAKASLLKVFVALGVRCIQKERGEEKDVVLHSLESVFSVEYLKLDDLTEEEIKEFANFNSVHNVWPFWRQHVYDTMKQGSLPVPEVPFFPGRASGSD